MLVGPQRRRVGLETDVFQRDPLDQFVSLCDGIKIDSVTLCFFLYERLVESGQQIHSPSSTAALFPQPFWLLKPINTATSSFNPSLGQ